MAYETGWDWAENVHKSAQLRWDTDTLAWVKVSGGTTTGQEVEVTNFPATYPVTAGDALAVYLVASTPTIGSVNQGNGWDVRLIASSATIGTVAVSTTDRRLIASSATIGTVNAVQSGGWDTRLIASSATIGTANPATSFGKTITYVSVAQGAAGTTELAAASGGNRHKLVGACLVGDAAGTVSFTDGTVTLCGAMSIAANAGFVLPTGLLPYTQTAAVNRPLNLVTATAKVSGMVAILTEP